MIRITRNLWIEKKLIKEKFIHAAGPGGQNVNKVASAVQLRFDLAGCTSLPEDVKERLIKLAGRKLTEQGILVIEARRYREQEKNRQDALNRLKSMIKKAAVSPKKRKPTRPTRASREKRLSDKHHMQQRKKSRQKIRSGEYD
jgi:ribosome-associated protein